MSNQRRWQKLAKQEAAELEAIFLEREPYCVLACSMYCESGFREPVWALRDSAGRLNSVIIQHQKKILPVLCGRREVPLPLFLRGFWGTAIHSAQGLLEDIIVLQKTMEAAGIRAVETIEYDLLAIDRAPYSSGFSAGPPGLIIRKPQFTDMDALAALQAGYEQEEVLTNASTWLPATSRFNIERIFRNQQMLAAELGGRLVGKINTNAQSFSRYQIGGVYVLPDFRGMGIARRMVSEFVYSLVDQGWGISLFVKKTNAAARTVYQRLGFSTLGDYRISYY